MIDTPHLAVVEFGDVRKEELEREFKQFDLGLFLDAEWDGQFQRLVYSVKLFMGPENPPHLVTDWRDPRTREPLELSWGLYHKVRRQAAANEGLRRPLVEEVRRENDERQAKLAEESERHYRETAIDMLPAVKGTRGPGFHRPTTAEGIAAARRRARRRDLERYLGLR